MNKVITINLNGNAYQLEEDGFQALRAYLETAGRRMQGNPDKDEIIADIEQAIAEKFRAVLGANKTVVVTREVEAVIAEMGPVQDASQPEDGHSPAHDAAAPGQAADDAGGAEPPPHAASGAPKRLYRIREGAMVGGVCNGLAAYLGIDVTIIRILFAFLTVTLGAGVLLYVVMMFIIPQANTPSERDAAYGVPSTAEEFIRRAKEGYYGGMRSFKDRKAYREWKGQFKREMRQRSHEFRRDMQRNVHQWSRGWHQHWAQPPHPHAGSWIAVTVLTFLGGLITLLGVSAVLSLVVTGSVFGLALPHGLPLWAGILLLIVVFRVLTWPLNAMRHGYYDHGGRGPWPCGSSSCIWNSFGWLAFLIFSVWVLDRHVPEAHDALSQLRHDAHHAVSSLRDWWASR